MPPVPDRTGVRAPPISSAYRWGNWPRGTGQLAQDLAGGVRRPGPQPGFPPRTPRPRSPLTEPPTPRPVPQVQSFLRGWLCRRKWKTIIQDYIRSPHADSMRKRNQVVFSMLEAEAEYVQQLHILVNNFLRPLRMAASSKKPPITHDDVSSIFLNR